MKKIITLLLLATAVACNNTQSYKKAEDAQDAGREFIRASLDGDYDKAKYYMLGDSTNRYLLERWKNSYDNLSKEEKDKYKDAEIVVLDLHRENDSVTSYKYFNSYKKDTTTVKVMLVHGEWVVDMKELMKMNK
ncbi:MAG TPA: hypothetical protein VKT28_09600 [Puia sp.]|nr:hypothetical protein [Puia sp.]